MDVNEDDKNIIKTIIKKIIKVIKISSFVHRGKKYYTTKREALRARRTGDRIYYSYEQGAYYIIRPRKKTPFWRFL